MEDRKKKMPSNLTYEVVLFKDLEKSRNCAEGNNPQKQAWLKSRLWAGVYIERIEPPGGEY